MTPRKIIIIGAGFGGLSSAALLAKDGHDVTVIEKNDMAGGRARVWNEAGFKFDMGPSWYLMPDAFERFFNEFSKKPTDYYKLTRLDPSYRIYFGKDDSVDISSDLKKNIALFESMEAGAGEKLQEYLDQAEYQYNVSMSEFLYKDFRSIFDFLNKRMMVEGRKLHVFENLHAFTGRFFKNDKLRKILEYSMVFLGGAPKNTPALYSVINHADMNLGVWYPDGGYGAVVEGIKTLAEELGVKFVFSESVESLQVENGTAKRVKTNKGLYVADIVIANADYHHVETSILPKEEQSYSPRYWDKRTMAPSAFIMYLGLNKRLENVTHHMLMLDNDWMRHFNDIFEKPTWPEHPSYYVCCPSQTDPTTAPEGCENLFVLVPIASGLEDTPEMRESYYEKIMEHLENTLGQDIKDSVIVKRMYSLNDFKEDYNAFQGTALGLSHTLWQTSLLRPRTKSKKIKNLYFAGQFTQPGIGVPMTLISGQIARDNIREDWGDND